MSAIAVAQNVDGEFSLDNLNLGWSTSYDIETHRTTFDTSWSGRGWNYVEFCFSMSASRLIPAS